MRKKRGGCSGGKKKTDPKKGSKGIGGGGNGGNKCGKVCTFKDDNNKVCTGTCKKPEGHEDTGDLIHICEPDGHEFNGKNSVS